MAARSAPPPTNCARSGNGSTINVEVLLAEVLQVLRTEIGIVKLNNYEFIQELGIG